MYRDEKGWDTILSIIFKWKIVFSDILTEVDDELFFQDSSTREEFESLKAYKKDQEEKLNS